MIIPLGVLAASDAARACRRGWRALFITLIILAPIAAWFYPLAGNLQILFTLYSSPCNGSATCTPIQYGTPLLVTQIGWAVAYLPIPIAALVYSLAPAQSATASAATEADQGERRALIVWAIVGIVVMSALGYLATSPFLFLQFGNGSPERMEMILPLRMMLNTVWVALAALPVAIVSMALAHAAETGRRGWLVGWIALAALTLLTASPVFPLAMHEPWTESFILAALGGAGQQAPDDLYIKVSIVAPVVIMLVALIYAAVSRPGSRGAALATA
ncbi:MAG TPA: hypothetical protein VF792_03270 [Ktedonobacterales bacterium]